MSLLFRLSGMVMVALFLVFLGVGIRYLLTRCLGKKDWRTYRDDISVIIWVTFILVWLVWACVREWN